MRHARTRRGNQSLDGESAVALPENGGKHVVITVHGIRTFGHWQKRLQDLVAPENPDIAFYHYQYGYFSLLAFVIPFTRWIVVERFRRELRSIAARTRPGRLDLVGHSFGTHLIAWALQGLRAEEDIQVHTAILAGSVLRSDFYWAGLIPGRVKRVVNDCGAKDSVLLASQFLVLFTGMAGRVGFVGMNGPEFLNRYSMFGHGGYFEDSQGKSDDAYMLKYWVPLVAGEGAIAELDRRNAPTPWRGLIIWVSNNFEPIKLLMVTAPLVAGLIFVGALYVEANATKERMAAVIDLGQAMRGKNSLPPEAVPLLATMQNALAIPLRRTTVLWVDDDPTANVLEQAALSRFGLCFTRVASAAEALRLLDAHPGRYAAVISDFRRDGDPHAGYGLLDEMKKRKLAIPFIFYVLRFTPEQANEARLRGAQAQVRGAIDLWVEVLDAMTVRGSASIGRIELIMQQLLDCREHAGN